MRCSRSAPRQRHRSPSVADIHSSNCNLQSSLKHLITEYIQSFCLFLNEKHIVQSRNRHRRSMMPNFCTMYNCTSCFRRAGAGAFDSFATYGAIKIGFDWLRQIMSASDSSVDTMACWHVNNTISHSDWTSLNIHCFLHHCCFVYTCRQRIQ